MSNLYFNNIYRISDLRVLYRSFFFTLNLFKFLKLFSLVFPILENLLVILRNYDRIILFCFLCTGQERGTTQLVVKGNQVIANTYIKILSCKMNHLLVTVISLLIIITAVSTKKLETVPDNEFLKLVKSEKYVVALFSKTFNQSRRCS